MDSIVATIKKYNGDTGREIAYSNNSLPFGLPNGLGSEVSAMKRAGVQVVITCFDINGSTTLETELDRRDPSSPGPR